MNRQPKRIDLNSLWTLVWSAGQNGGQPVIPYDSNPGCDDEGMLVYFSEAAAKNAAAHQLDLYEISCEPIMLADLRMP